MDSINKHFGSDPRYLRLKKPLAAANVCGVARSVAEGRFGVVSFKDGLLTLAADSPSSANNLRMELYNIQKELNQKLGKEVVEKIRIKIEQI